MIRDMSQDDARQRLGQHVRRRRTFLGLTIDEAAERGKLSPVTWARVEQGKKVRDLTYGAVDRVLGWASGSAHAVLDGGEPAIAEDATRTPALTALPGGRPDITDLQAAERQIRALPLDADRIEHHVAELYKRAGATVDAARQEAERARRQRR